MERGSEEGGCRTDEIQAVGRQGNKQEGTVVFFLSLFSTFTLCSPDIS